MRIELVRKIQALADDTRGHPEVRQRAAEKIAELRRAYPHLFEPPKPPKPEFHDVRTDPRVHGMRTDPAYDYYIFTDLSLWDQTKAGNKTHTIYHKGINYRIVLFQHRKSPTWGWMQIGDPEGTVFSGRFKTVGEAQGDSWASLMAL